MSKIKSGGLAKASKAVRAISSMNPALMKVFTEGRGVLNEVSSGVISAYRTLGKLIKTVRDSPDKYKSGAVELLSAAYGVSAPLLYRAQALAEQYTDVEFKAMCNLKGPDGSRLNWSHIVCLLSVPDKAVRAKFQQQAVSNGWTAEELHTEIQGKYGNRRVGVGQKFAQPKTIVQGLNNFTDFTLDFLKRVDQIWDGTLTDLVEIPPDQFTVDAYERVLKLSALQGRAAETYTEQMNKSRQAAQVMETALRRRNLLPEDA